MTQPFTIFTSLSLSVFVFTLLLRCQISASVELTTLPLEHPRTSLMKVRDKNSTIEVIFSDVDGTLVHYPGKNPLTSVQDEDDKDYEKIMLPASSTGMQGVISRKTLTLCQLLRKEHGKKLVLVSGMRTTTLLQRLPFLPAADAYCSENGGRIFYPTGNEHELKEDLSWRKLMEAKDAAGPDGYEIKPTEKPLSKPSDTVSSIAVSDREGKLWEFARLLISKGWILDYKGYATSFRIKFRSESAGSEEELLRLLPNGLSSSINLGMADVYPEHSGKVNVCKYLCSYFTGKDISQSCVCMCDDDNDIEMALACKHAFLPHLSSQSMIETVNKNEEHFTVTCQGNIAETRATDAALEAILEKIYLD